MTVSLQKDYNIEMYDNNNLSDKYSVKNIFTTSKSAHINVVIVAYHENIAIYSDDNDYLGDISAEIQINLTITTSIEELIYFMYNAGQDCRINDSQIDLTHFELLNYNSKDNIDRNVVYKYLKNTIEQYYGTNVSYCSPEYELYVKFST